MLGQPTYCGQSSNLQWTCSVEYVGSAESTALFLNSSNDLIASDRNPIQTTDNTYNFTITNTDVDNSKQVICQILLTDYSNISSYTDGIQCTEYSKYTVNIVCVYIVTFFIFLSNVFYFPKKSYVIAYDQVINYPHNSISYDRI